MLSRLTRLDLPPDAFAVVMATGIVSVAARQHHYLRIGDALEVVAVAMFVTLAAGLVLRVGARFGSAVREIQDPDVALRMFTACAACAVLGVRFQDSPVALDVLGVLAAASWLFLVPLAIRDVRRRPRADLRDHAHGAWLLPSVATCGLAITAVDVGRHGTAGALLWLSAALWLLGLCIYGAVTWLIAWRSVAAPFRPELVTPDSWILLGALAIATLASARLLNAARDIHFDAWLIDVMHPATLVLWWLASAWAPLLLYAEVWRLDQEAGSLHYAGVWWSAVFPLGMYSSATASSSVALDIHAMATVSLVVFWVAFTVWLVVAMGWLHRAARRIRGATR
jgi:tellurite resistance protein TehA-like permease